MSGVHNHGDDNPLSRRSLLLLFSLALLPRLAVSLTFLHAPIGLDDMFQYDMLGRSLAAGQGYRWYGREDVQRLEPYLKRYYQITLEPEQVPEQGYQTTFRAPGYPFLLAVIYRLVGMEARIAAVRILQSLLSALLAPLTALLALEVGLPPRPARWAGGVVVLYPILWMYPVGLASENLFLPLLLAGMLYLIRGAQPGRKPSLWFSGLLLGAATLTRGGLVFFLPLAALWLAWVNRRWRALLFLLIPLFVLLPWSLRNSLLLGRPAFVENSMGYNLFVGYHPQGNGGFVTEVAAIPTRFLDDAQRDSWAMNQAIGFIREDPPRALELLLRRLGYFWGLEDRELLYFYSNGFFGEIPQPWLGLAYGILVLPLIGLGLSAPFGCAVSLKGRESRGHWLMLGLIAATHLAYIPILAEPRFHLPLVPVLALWASQFWSAPQPLKALRMGIRKGEWVWWGATGVALLLVALWAWDLWQSQEVLLAVMQPGGHQLRLSY